MTQNEIRDLERKVRVSMGLSPDPTPVPTDEALRRLAKLASAHPEIIRLSKTNAVVKAELTAFAYGRYSSEAEVFALIVLKLSEQLNQFANELGT